MDYKIAQKLIQRNTELSFAEKAILQMLLRLSLHKGYAFPTTKFLAEENGTTEVYVAKVLASLKKQGLITIEKEGRQRHIFLHLQSIGISQGKISTSTPKKPTVSSTPKATPKKVEKLAENSDKAYSDFKDAVQSNSSMSFTVGSTPRDKFLSCSTQMQKYLIKRAKSEKEITYSSTLIDIVKSEGIVKSKKDNITHR
jgi:predicted transcriptional regulator